MQKIYAEPVKPELIARRIAEIKAEGVLAAASLTPQRVREHWQIALDAGLDVLVIQGTVVSAEHVSTVVEPLNLKQFIAELPVPVIVGGCASYQAALHLMRTGAAGVLVGVGPGAACTTRGVLGVGRAAGDRDRRRLGGPHPAPARDRPVRERDRRRRHAHRRRHLQGDRLRRRRGDDRLAAGAGATRRRATATTGAWRPSTPACPAAPGCRPSRWPRSRQIVVGPATENDGTLNLMGALRTSMATTGYDSIQAFQKAEIMFAPALQTEGKKLQREQAIGMSR